MRIRFCSGGFSCLVLILAMGILLGMGTWQLQRAQEKKEILQQYEQQSAEKAIALNPSRDDYAELRYRDVTAIGRYDEARQFLLDNQIRNRQAGYSVLTPFQMKNGKSVLVDRGWVPQGLTRQLLPKVDIQELETAVTGQVYVPFGRAFSLGSIDSGSQTWPRVIQYVEFSEISARLGYDLLPLTIRLEPKAADGYLREWITVPFTPARHVAYAVQWFGLAIALLLIVVIAMSRMSEKHNTRDD